MQHEAELLYAGVGKTVMAFDRFSGRPAWRVKLPRLLAGSISMVVPHGNEVYVGRGSYVYCLDRMSGRVLWERGMGTMSGVLVLGLSGTGAEVQQQASVAGAAAVAAAADASG